MLHFQSVQIVESRDYPVAQGFTVTAEGQALVADYTGGQFGVKPSTGTAGEQFVGVSISQQLTILAMPETVTVVIAEKITLPHVPLNGTLLVMDTTTGTALTPAAGDPASGQYSINGKELTFNSAQSGDDCTISYRYSPTTMEARTIQGDIPPGGAANLTLDTMGVILKGQVATFEYDTSVNWQVANPVLKLGANGLFTLGGSGVDVPGAVIVDLPVNGGPLVFEI